MSMLWENMFGEKIFIFNMLFLYSDLKLIHLPVNMTQKAGNK